jgi:MFS family permease
VALGLTSFFTDVATEMIFPLMPVFVVSLGASATFLGVIEGVAEATASLLKLATGYLSDRLARKKPLVLAGYLLATLSRPLVALATAPWHVLAVRVTDRVGKGIRSAPRDALIAAAAPEGGAGRAFGFHRAMDHAGAVVGPLVATLLLGLGVALRDVFWLALIPGALAVATLLAVREVPTPPAPAAEAAAGRLSPALRGYLVILALFALGNSSDAFLLLRARDLGVPVEAVPLLWALLHGSKVVWSYVGGAYADRMPRTHLIVAGWCIYAFTYLGFGLASAPWQAWLLFAVYGVHHGLCEPAEKALVKDLAPAELRGRAYGFYNFTVGASAIPAGLLTGWLWESLGAFVALAVGAAIAAAAALALVVARPRSPSSSPPTMAPQ